MKKWFTPFNSAGFRGSSILVGGQLLAALLAWHWSASGIIPGPLPVARALGGLLALGSFWEQVLVSFQLTLQALGMSILIALLVAYTSLLPFFRPLAQFLVKCRYLTLTGLIFIFTLLTRDGSSLKLSLLVFGMVPFFVTSLVAALTARNPQEYELCETLGYRPWAALYETIIVGKAALALDILRQNFAIAWLMITLVEGLSMSEGGLGTLLIKYNKYNDLTHVLALQGILFGIGLLSDAALGWLRRWLFPYTRINTVKA